MRRIAQIVSWLALAATLLPACLYFADRCTLDQTRQWMLYATVAWFVATPLWMERAK